MPFLEKPVTPTLAKTSHPQLGQIRRYGLHLHRDSNTLKEIPFKKATAISTGLHILTPIALTALVALVLFVLSILLNFNLWDLFKPKDIPHDIEFTIVQNRQDKRPKEALFRGEFNQEAGGKQDPKKLPEPINKPRKPSSEKAEAPKPEPVQKPVPPQPMVKPQPKQQIVQKPQEMPAEKKPTPPVKQPIKKVEAPPVPLFKPAIAMPAPPKPPGSSPVKIASNSGPITNSSDKSHSLGPVTLPSTGTLAQQGNPGRMASAAQSSSSAGGLLGNPQQGPGRIPGVSVQEADFGPYMSELKRRLTRNWHPPRGDASKRVVLKFEIARDGRLLSLEVNRTSGEPLADQAAIEAVKLSAPFKQLPPDFQGESVPVLFTFDYTVYGGSRNQNATR
jgi:TonB family protein